MKLNHGFKVDYENDVLHCVKSGYQKDWRSGRLSEFYDEFIKYVIDNLFENQYLKNKIFTYLKNGDFKDNKYNEVFKKNTLVLNRIHFPERKSGDEFDYLKVLNLFKKIHFNFCEFYLSELDLKDTKCFFQDCIFHKKWNIYNYDILDNEDNVIYQTCKFEKKVSNYPSENLMKLAVYDHSQFDYTCEFQENIELDKCVFKKMLFNTNQFNFSEKNVIKLLKFNFCTFEEKFKLNNYHIEKFICMNSEFKDKFEFKENKLSNLKIENSNFYGISDFFASSFQKFSIIKCIFNDFVNFENCIFGSDNKSKELIATFKYVTFKDLFNIRGAKFLSALDIKYINLQGELNSLDLEIISVDDFSIRETFRILKYEADKIGNIIEANKYYQKEMEEREKELDKEFKKKPLEIFGEWIAFKIHNISSRHSQNWLLALFWIILITFLYSYLQTIFSYQEKIEYYIVPFIISVFIFIYALLEVSISKNISILHYIWIILVIYFIYTFMTNDFNLENFLKNINFFLKKSEEKNSIAFISLIYKIIMAYLIYQLIISVRQNTRRK